MGWRVRNIPKLKSRRRKLRKSLTPAEARLWTLVSRSQLAGFKFRRQHSVGPYIVDFFCAERSLAIELDGEGHFNPWQAEADRRRTRHLASLGIRVLRFENRRVFDSEASVLREILASLES